MKIVKFHFYLLVCCGAAEGSTEKSVDLGQDVTLDCDVTVKDALWFLMKPSEPPVFILRSFSSRSLSAEYSNMTFSKTFSVQYNSSLFIHNISSNELGVYYCIQAASPPNISSGIRLYIQNHSAENQACEFEGQQKCCRSFFIVLGIISLVVVVVVVLTVCRVCCCKRSPKSQDRPPDAGLQPRQNNAGPVYEEVQYNVTNGCVRTTDPNSTYFLLQPPKP